MATDADVEPIVDMLSRLIHERDVTLTALGLRLDVDEGEVSEAAKRMVDDLERHEQAVSMLLDVAMATEVELQATRETLSNVTATANRQRDLLDRQRDLLDEVFAALGVDRTSEDAASDLVAMAHSLRAWSPPRLETMAVFHAEAFPCL